MTKENLDGFIQKVISSKELQQDLQSCNDKSTLVNKVMKLAPGVTAEDVEAALKERSENIKKEIGFPLNDEVFDDEVFDNEVFRAY